MSVHEAIAACPVVGDADKALIRAMCTRRFSYNLASTEVASSFTVVDPASGVVPLYLVQNGLMFAYDATDSTTPFGATTCLVSADGKRFKTDAPAYPWSVLSRTVSAQPVLPSVGARYLIPVAATGADWAGKDNMVGAYTPGGWRFDVIPIGRELYIEDVDQKYYRNAAGTWTRGAGSLIHADNSVPVSAVIGKPVRWIVVNQTTNTPPVSPTIGVAYIVGPAPTGAWVGHTGKIAICESGSTFTIYAPRAGELAYDTALAVEFQYLATGTWTSSSGLYVAGGFQYTQAAAGTITGTIGSNYAYLVASAPVQTNRGYEDPVVLSYAAKAAGKYLEFEYHAVSVTWSGTTFAFPVGLFIGSTSAAIAWGTISNFDNSTQGPVSVVFPPYAAPDAASHDYKIKFFTPEGTSALVSWSHRDFRVKERG